MEPIQSTVNDLLVIVDMQEDFTSGSLGTPEARAIIPGIRQLIRSWNGSIVFTKDTHLDNYMETQEGRKLPVPHCIEGTIGHAIASRLDMEAYAKINRPPIRIYEKNTFGAKSLIGHLESHPDYENIYLCGVCTGICVLSNAVLAKTILPEVPIRILSELCACVTPESHERALESMRTLQMEII